MSHEQPFAIKPRWPEKPAAGDVDLAEIGIWHGYQSLSTIHDRETADKRPFIRGSAVSLAFWLADNWWRLRCEPIPSYGKRPVDWRLRHELTSVSGGTRWPPLMIYGAGSGSNGRVVIAPISGEQPRRGGSMAFEPAPVTPMSGQNFETAVDTFFDRVRSNCALSLDGECLDEVVDQLTKERADDDTVARRRLEAILGFDPDHAPTELMETLFAQEGRFGLEGLDEAAAAVPGLHSAEALSRAVEAAEASRVEVDFQPAIRAVGPIGKLGSVKIWELAERAAGDLKQKLGVPSGPLLNKALGDLLSTSSKVLMETNTQAAALSYGARLKYGHDQEKIALRRTSDQAKRFELARNLGDAIWTDDAVLGIVGDRYTDRQKFQRAFAQSLLCPFDDLYAHYDLDQIQNDRNRIGKVIDAARRRYHVSKFVVQTLLVNKGILPRSSLAESLEAA